MRKTHTHFSLPFPIDPEVSLPLVSACFRDRFETVFGDQYSVRMEPKETGRLYFWQLTIHIRRGLLHGVHIVVKRTSDRCSISIFHRSLLETIVYNGTYLVMMVISCIAGLLMTLPYLPPGRKALPSLFMGIVLFTGIGFLGATIINLMLMPLYDVVFYVRKKSEHKRLMAALRKEVHAIMAVLSSANAEKGVKKRGEDP